MTGKAGPVGVTPRSDRRSGADRRKVDTPRKGLPERRLSVESRQPDVVEIEMSSSEWGALRGDPNAPRSQ